jgi:hypothetical protein
MTDSELPTRVKHAGVLRVVDYKNAMIHAENRKFAGVADAGVQLYRDVVKAAADDDVLNVDKYVDLWYDLDVANNIKYATTVIDPHSAFYSGPAVDEIEKAADENVGIAGVLVPKHVFENIEPKKFAMYLDGEQAEKFASVADTATKSAMEATYEISQWDNKEAVALLKFLQKHA